MKQQIFLFGLIVMLASCSVEENTPQEKQTDVPALTELEEKELHEQAAMLLGSLPKQMPGAEHDTPEQIALGKMLYHDVLLSENKTQSCNTCHNVNNGGFGVDNEPTSKGAFGKRGDRNSPTVLNAGYQFVQFWDGRAADLAEQAKGPVLNPVEMAMPDEATMVGRLEVVPEYVKAFNAAFPRLKNSISYANMASAIASFERTLISRSRFDDYVEGNQKALTTTEKRGLQEFFNAGCTMCHNGPLLGGAMYQRLGLVHPYSTKDLGRGTVTKDAADSMMFKVPQLRNIALTAPYFHDGSVTKLDEAIRLMAWYQLDKKLSTTQITSIAAFLGALTDPGRGNTAVN